MSRLVAIFAWSFGSEQWTGARGHVASPLRRRSLRLVQTCELLGVEPASVEDDGPNASGVPNVGQRVGIQDHQICHFAGLDRANLIGEPDSSAGSRVALRTSG